MDDRDGGRLNLRENHINPIAHIVAQGSKTIGSGHDFPHYFQLLIGADTVQGDRVIDIQPSAPRSSGQHEQTFGDYLRLRERQRRRTRR
jgi:hypothetical protein